MKKYLLFACALGAAALTSCQDEEMGATKEQVHDAAYTRAFQKEFGTEGAEFNYDYYVQALNKVKNGGTATRGTAATVAISDSTTYEWTDQTNPSLSAVVTAANTMFPDDKDNSTKANKPSIYLQDTEFTISTINYGGWFETRQDYDHQFEFGMQYDGKNYPIFYASNSGTWKSTGYNPQWTKKVTGLDWGSNLVFYVTYLDDDYDCEDCEGIGAIGATVCTNCSGKGYTTSGDFWNITYTGCSSCGGSGSSRRESGITKGTGYTGGTKCTTCNGTGWKRYTYLSDSENCAVATDAITAGGTVTGFFTVIAFEDEPISDKMTPDYNDIIFAITADHVPFIVENDKRFMCEDMSVGTNNTYPDTEWDFNDIVFDIATNSTTLDQTTTQTTTIVVQAVGGTWPIYLYLTDGTTTHMVGDDELHLAFATKTGASGITTATPINVNAAKGVDVNSVMTLQYTDLDISKIDLKSTSNTYVYAKVYIGTGDYKTDTENWRTLSFQVPDGEQSCRIIATTDGTPWMKEDTNIRKGYPNFPAAGCFDTATGSGYYEK